MEFSVPMALADFVPVVLFLIGAILLQRELYPRLGKGQFALFAAGTINVFCAGALKAVYKLLYALGVCDFTKLNEVFFPVQSIGFLLAGLAMAAFLFYKPKKTTICGVAAAPAVYSGTALFVSLMVVGLGLLDAVLIALAVREKKRGIVVLLVVSFVCSLCMGYLSSRDFSAAAMNWIAEGVNIVGQGTFLAAAVLLRKAGKEAAAAA